MLASVMPSAVPPIFLRNQRREPAELGKFAHERVGIGFLTIDLTPVRVRKLFADFLDLFADLLLLDGQVEIHYFLL